MAVIRRSQKTIIDLNKPVYYSDLKASFDTHPNTKDVPIIQNEDAIKTSIRNLLLTRRGERFFNPLLGSDIYSILFENSSPAASADLRNFISNTIENFEPRANLIDIKVTPYSDDNGYNVSIIFSVINRTEPVQMNILLDRIR